MPDFPADRDPAYRPPEGAKGPAAIAGDDPFIMQADGKGWLFAPKGLLDGPLPSHYEPQEGRVRNPFYSQQASPTRKVYERPDNLTAPSGGRPPEDEVAREHPEVYPFIFTTYRLTEHHTAGGMSRWLPYLAELQPEMFCEVSPELAAERGLEHLGWATLVSPRSAIEARVLVTSRMKPLAIDGRTFHQIGLPYHWATGGTGAIVSGDSTNDLMGVTLDPNVLIPSVAVPARSRRTAPCLHSRSAAPSRPRQVMSPAVVRTWTTWSRSARPRSRSMTTAAPTSRVPPRSDPTTRTVTADAQLPVRPPGPGARRRLAGRPGPQGLPHRHVGLHRLQGL